jgi:type IV pilus assembly protein PilF
MIRKLLSLVSLSMLVACASSPNRDIGEGSTARQTAEINTSLGREYMERGQLEIALDKLKKATRADSSYAPGHTVLAVLYKQIGEIELAEQHYKLAVEAAPSNGDVNNNYGVFLCQSGKAGEAINFFLKAVEDPFYRTPAVALSNAGSCEIQSGNLDNAERYLRQSLEYDAEFADTLLSLANVSLMKRENFRARAFLQRFEGRAAVTAASLALGMQIEAGLQNEAGSKEYEDRLLTRFPDSEQARDLRNR